MEVALIPLDTASDTAAGGTFAGGLRKARIALTEDHNEVVFNLIPSNSPGLTEPINYRVMWRTGITGKTFNFDFAMPDVDCTWDELQDLGNIIDGQVYLQQADLGVPNRVARLNAQGQVVNAANEVVATSTDFANLQSDLNLEKVNRAAAISALNTSLQGTITTQVASTLSTARAYTDNQLVSVNDDISTERSQRISADDSLQSQVTTNLGTLTSLGSTYSTFATNTTTALAAKANLSGGKVPLGELPDSVITRAFVVANQSAMLALSSSLVTPGDIAVRPDGVWLLNGADPTTLSNWVGLTTVSSVNGARGAVTLTASDVGAIATGGSIAQSQVTGLATALTGKANQIDLSTLQTSVTTILNDMTYVHTSGGVVPTALMSADVVQINGSGQLVKKNGDIIPLGEGGTGAVFSVQGKTGLVVLTASDVGAVPTGGSILQTQVTGLSTSLSNKADLVSGTVPTAQIPALAISKTTGLQAALDSKPTLTGGLVSDTVIPVLANTKITGLAAQLTGNQLTSSSNAINRISSLETRVTTVEGGGGGGGGGTSSTTVFYDSSELDDPVTNFTDVTLHSPWGIDSDSTITGTIGTPYYLRDGVRSQDVAYPYISANGHLNVRRWNEAGAADPSYALASTVSTLTTTVGTKASQTDLNTLTTTVGTKANQSDLTTLQTAVDDKAAAADLTALTTTVGGKASQASVDTLTTTVGTKANQSALDTLTTTVGTKAPQSGLDTANTNIATINTALTTKADLSGGRLATGQIPTTIPQASVVGLVTALSGKADLVSGAVPLGQLPDIPQNRVTGLGTTLGAKADLVSGKVPMSQIPLGALPNVVVVANRAAMLALTSADVQYGDLVLITATADAGTYVLVGSGGVVDPSQFSHWLALTTSAAAPVVSVNGQSGVVSLTYTDVGAMSATATGIPQASISGLTASLAAKVDTTTHTTDLGTKVNTTDLRSMWYTSSMVKRADYVATSAVVSLSGFKTADSVLMPSGAVVLLTAQSSSVDNGLWVVSGGSWQRAPDYGTGQLIAKDHIVIVNNQTGSAAGAANPNTIWQISGLVVGASAANVGFVDNAASTWTRIGYSAPPFSPVGGNGVSITGTTFAAVPAPTILNPSDVTKTLGGGINVTSTGLSADPNWIPRKYVNAVPPGSVNAVINHNLSNANPQVSIWDVATGSLVLAGVQSTGPNTLTIEFASAPSTNQYKVCVIG